MRKALLQKRKNECQQCQDEHSKGHKVFKVKMSHLHHPPFYVRIEVSHPVTRLLRRESITQPDSSEQSFFKFATDFGRYRLSAHVAARPPPPSDLDKRKEQYHSTALIIVARSL